MAARKSKILLIRPNNFLSVGNYPPLALILTGSALEKAGYEVEIYTASSGDHYLETIGEKIRDDDLLFVGLTALTTEVADALKISREIKRISDVPVVWGGWHGTLFPQQCVDSNFIDYVIVDEGDFSVVELAHSLANGDPSKNKIITSEKHLSMDELPCPNYSLVDNIEEFITSPLGDKFQEVMNHPIRWLPYQSSRGCPSECAFCINIVTDNQQFRAKSPRKIVDELEGLIREYNLTHFKILDDNFFVSRKRVKEFCGLIIDRKLSFTWDGECRVDYFRDDYLNDDYLQMLKKAGLVQLVMGAESGSRKTLEYLNKNIVPEQTETAIESLQRNGIIADCSFIVGLPGETRVDLMETATFINKQRKHKLFICGVQTYRPYPRSKIAQQLIAEGKLEEPGTVEEWSDEKVVAVYTYVDAYRPWIRDYKLAMNISYYQSLASGVWLLQHQIEHSVYKLINMFFRRLARFRSKYFLFRLPLDKKLYSLFRLKMSQKVDHNVRKKRAVGEGSAEIL